MDNTLQVFQNDEFGKIRVLEVDGQPCFIGNEIASVLGYTNPRKALIDHVDLEDKNTVTIRDGIQGNPNKTIINESGLYSLILSSKLPKAKDFKRWVTSKVLPSIRKHGAYITDDTLNKMLNNSEYAQTLLLNIQADRKKISDMQECIEVLEPKARYCDIILQCKSAIPITLIAKDYDYSGSALNAILHGFGIQYKVGGTWVMYQCYGNKGYTVSKTYQVCDGKSVTHTYWTQRGRLFLYELLKSKGILPVIEREQPQIELT